MSVLAFEFTSSGTCKSSNVTFGGWRDPRLLHSSSGCSWWTQRPQWSINLVQTPPFRITYKNTKSTSSPPARTAFSSISSRNWSTTSWERTTDIDSEMPNLNSPVSHLAMKYFSWCWTEHILAMQAKHCHLQRPSFPIRLSAVWLYLDNLSVEFNTNLREFFIHSELFQPQVDYTHSFHWPAFTKSNSITLLVSLKSIEGVFFLCVNITSTSLSLIFSQKPISSNTVYVRSF